MIKKLQYYFMPKNPSLTFKEQMMNVMGFSSIEDVEFFIENTLTYSNHQEHPTYGVIGISPTLLHSNFESYEPSDSMRCMALFEDGSEMIGNFYMVDVNTSVFLNRYVMDDFEIDEEGTLTEACIGEYVSAEESSQNFKVINLPNSANSITKISSENGTTNLLEESFFDSTLKKVYVLTPLDVGDRITVCYSDEIVETSIVENISGFDMSRMLAFQGEFSMVANAKKSGRKLIPFGRWVFFAIRLWVYLQLPTILGAAANRGPAWEPGELADTIVDYYKQTVMGAFNIWSTFPDLNPGEQGMRQVLKGAFKLMFYSGPYEDLRKLADPLIKLSVMVFWFGAFLKKIPPPGSIQNVISPVIFPGIPFVTPPTPNTDSTQMAREFAFMFAVHSLTLVGFEIGMVPVGTAVVPIPYPFVAMI